MYNNYNNPQEKYFEARVRELAAMRKIYNTLVFNTKYAYNLYETHPQCDSHDFELCFKDTPTIIVDVKNRNYDLKFFTEGNGKSGFMVERYKLEAIRITDTYKKYGKAILVCTTNDGYYFIFNLSTYIDRLDDIQTSNITAGWNTVNGGTKKQKNSVLLPVSSAYKWGKFDVNDVFSEVNIKKETEYVCQQNYQMDQITYVKY